MPSSHKSTNDSAAIAEARKELRELATLFEPIRARALEIVAKLREAAKTAPVEVVELADGEAHTLEGWMAMKIESFFFDKDSKTENWLEELESEAARDMVESVHYYVDEANDDYHFKQAKLAYGVALAAALEANTSGWQIENMKKELARVTA